MALNLNCIATRLKQTRETLEYTISQVYEVTGINTERLLAIESCGVCPSGDEVLILANLYNCDFRSLINENLPPPVQQTDILFRRYGNAFHTEDKRSVQEFLYLCRVEAELEKVLDIQSKSFSCVPKGTFLKGHGQQAADSLRTLIGYRSNEVPRDVYADFRSIGIHVFRRKLLNSEISGLYVEDPQAGHCVLINYNEDVYRQRFSVAHEVAHAIFDSSDAVMLTYNAGSSRYDQKDRREIRANSFASHYLMPISMLNQLNIRDESTALFWAQEFRVSTAALAKALKDAGIIDEDIAKRIRNIRVPRNQKIDPEAPDYLSTDQRKRRAGLLEHGLSDYYVGLCFRAFDRELISSARMAEILRVDHATLSEVAFLFGRKISHDL